MVRRSPPKKKPPVMRSVLVELPEPQLLALSAKAKDAGVSAHVLAAKVLAEWLEG